MDTGEASTRLVIFQDWIRQFMLRIVEGYKKSES